MKPLSIALKLWLPAIAVSVGLVAMASGSAIRTIRSQAITVAEQSEQQSKLEMAARWGKLPDERQLRTIVSETDDSFYFQETADKIIAKLFNEEYRNDSVSAGTD